MGRAFFVVFPLPYPMSVDFSQPLVHEGRVYFNPRLQAIELPDLIEVQKSSYDWFLKEGLKELFDEISPITDFIGRDLELSFVDYYLDEPKFDETTARARNATYEAPLRVKARLANKRTGAAGVFFTSEYVRGRRWYGAKIIPNRGAWLEIETAPTGIISVKIDRKRKVPITALFRAFGMGTDEEIVALFRAVDTDADLKYIETTVAKDVAHSEAEGLREVYKRIRP